jgi:ribosome recycling factor
MQKALEVTQRELSSIRTGQASPSLVENIKVEYYGATLPLNQISSISAPEARLIVIHPWDKNAIDPIMKSIQRSSLGLNPSTNGNLIRLNIPPLTEERRKELDRFAREKAEEGRIAIRNIRRDANHSVKALEEEGKISKDEAFKAREKIQKITDEFIGRIDEALSSKEKEILEF